MSVIKEVNDIVYKVIGSCMEVHKTLGPGLTVDFYKKAMEIELGEKGLVFDIDRPYDVKFKDISLGENVIDFVIQDKVIIEIKSQDELKDSEIQYTLRNLGYAGANIGVLVNFGGTKIQYRRILPSRQNNQNQHPNQINNQSIKKEALRPLGYRDVSRTREGNPVI